MQARNEQLWVYQLADNSETKRTQLEFGYCNILASL